MVAASVHLLMRTGYALLDRGSWVWCALGCQEGLDFLVSNEVATADLGNGRYRCVVYGEGRVVGSIALNGCLGRQVGITAETFGYFDVSGAW